MLSKETIAAAKKSVKERLKRKGIAVYFVAFEIDGGYPYFVYAFDREIAEEAKKIYSDGYVTAEAFDDYAMDKNAIVEAFVPIRKAVLKWWARVRKKNMRRIIRWLQRGCAV